MEENQTSDTRTLPTQHDIDGSSEFEAFSCFIISKDSKARRWMIQLIKWPWFERISMFVILINCVTLAMYNPLDPQCTSTRCQVLENVEHVVFAFFFAEMVIKMLAMGVTGKKGYLQDKWNRLDCFIVVIGLIEKVIKSGNYLTIMRAFRVLRPLRAINKVPSIRILVTLLLDTLPMLGNVLLLSFLIFFVFGIIGVQLWQGKLRNRCFTTFPKDSAFFTRYNGSAFYQPSFHVPDFVCSTPEDHGTSKCSDIKPSYLDSECQGSFENNTVVNNTVCVNWNQYYINCAPDGPNPFYDTTSFDNIGIAWIAIFQVITLEGWSDIMYFVQDAHSDWNWIYFVVLIVMGSFFLVNLCLVVITMQFQETKAREIELMENSKDESRFRSSKPLNSLCKLLRTFCNCSSPEKEHVHHHHHHIYHHHHFHHHLYNCFVPTSPDPNYLPSANVPKIKVQEEGALSSSPDFLEEPGLFQDFLTPPEQTSRRSSKTSICSHTLSIHAETSSAVSVDEIVAQTKTSVKLSIPSPTTGFFAFSSSNTARRLNSSSGKTELSASTTVSAEINPLVARSSTSQDEVTEPSKESKEDHKPSIRPKDKDALKYRRFSQPAHVKLARTRKLGISSYNPSENFDEDVAELSKNEINPEMVDVEFLSPFDGNIENEHMENDTPFKELVLEKGDNECQPENTSSGGLKRPSLRRRNISTQSEDDMFESLFNLRQSASYDVTANHGAWQKLRTLCRKITESKQFTFVIMTAILLNMICMGLEHYQQPKRLTVALETVNVIFVSIFAVEMIIKLLGFGVTAYVSQGQNVFDGFIVIVSVCEILLSRGNSALSIFRSIRLLRIFKLVRPVRYQLLVVVKTMTSVMTFFGLLFLFIFAFAILGMNLFGGKFKFENAEGKQVVSRSNFDNFLWAMVSVFQVLTQENWNQVMYDGMRATSKWAALYFIALMAVGYYVLFNLLVAILVEGFTNSGKRKASPKPKQETGGKTPGEPLERTIEKPRILISKQDSQEPCPGNYNPESFPDFCGHGVRNALGTTFQHKTNFTPSLSMTTLEPLETKNSAATSEFKEANLTMPQLKKMRQESKMVKQRVRGTSLNAVGGDIESANCAAYNSGFLFDDLDGTSNLETLESESNTEVSSKRTPELTWKIDSSTIADRRSRTNQSELSLTTSRPESPQIVFQKNNSQEVYQLHECAAPESKARKVKIMKITETRSDWSLFLFSPANRLRRFLTAMCGHKYFDYVVLFFILISCVALALEEPNIPSNDQKRRIIDIAMLTLTIIFSFEMMIKIIAHGLVLGTGTYLKDAWNVLDGILVLFSWTDVIITYSSATAPEVLGALKVFRALRTLRPLRMIRRAPGLKLVVQTLLYSLKPIGNTVLIAAIFFVMFGILGVQIFKGTFHYCEGNIGHVTNMAECLNDSGRWENHMYNFDNLPNALISLFVFSTRDGWVEIMHNGIDAVGIDKQPIKNYREWRLAYFIPFLMLGGFLVLNMIVGVVVENFQRCREKLEDEEKQRRRRKLLEKTKNKNQEEVDRTYYESYSSWRRRIHDMCLHLYWDVTIAMVICLNVICMSLEHYQMSQTFEIFVETANYFFTGIFVLEVIFKFIAFGFVRYFKDRWNIVDLVIVILSLAGILVESLSSTRGLFINPTVARSLRVLRIIRVLKLVKLAKGVRSLLDTLFEALPQVANLGLLFLLLFFIYSCLGIQLFGTLECSPSQPCQGLGPHAHFRDFGTAMLTLFRIATGDNWNGILEDTLRSECSKAAECEKYCCVSKYTAPLFFVTFVLAAQFVLVNVVIAVLMKHLKESKEKIAANMAAKDLEQKLKLLTISAKNFIRAKAKKSELPISRRQSVVQLGLGGIELAQFKHYTPEKTDNKPLRAELARADAIFQEFLRLNANLQRVKMTIVRTASHNVQVTPVEVTPSARQRRNTVCGVRDLQSHTSNLNKFTVYKSGAKV